MKRFVFVLIALGFTAFANAQPTIDAIYNRYAGKTGFTSISISPQVFKLIAALDKNDEDLQKISEKFSGLKILVSEKGDTGFSNDISELIRKENLQILMEVVEVGKRINFYANEKNGVISSMILHAAEEGEEVLLSINGNFSLNELAQMGSSGKFGSESDHIALLRKLEEK